MRTTLAFLLVSLIYFTASFANAAELDSLPAELKTLVEQLSDGDDKVRKAAAKDLGKLKEKAKAAIPWLNKAMEKEENVYVKKMIRTALRRIGPDAGSTDDEQEAAPKKAAVNAGTKDADGYRIPLPCPQKNKLRVFYSPDGIGDGGGSGAKAKTEIKEIPGLKNNHKYMLIHMTGNEWSGKIINWAKFWDQSPLKIMPNQNTHLVLRCLYLGRPGDTNMTIAVQTQGGAQSGFVRLSNYDSKHMLQKSKHFVDIAIPLKDFYNTLPEGDREKPIWGVHFGFMSHQAEKDMGILLKHIAATKL